MKLLLDTHVLLWWATLDPALPARIKRAISRADNEIFVSAATAWEIATKARLAKLEWPAEAGSVNEYVLGQGFRPLPASLEHAERAGGLAVEQRDPFDRMLIAQAQIEDLYLASNEAPFDAAGVRRYWD